VIAALTLLLVFQLTGEVIARALGLPIPGPVIGMALLFVPAGTGIVLYGDRIAAEWLPLLVSLFISTLLTLAVTALVLKALGRRRGRPEEEGGR
jgi:holin-like protein